MKKVLLGLGLSAMALMLAGCGQQTATTQNTPADNGQPVATAPTEQKDNSIISSLKDAMGLGKQMKCTYTTTINGSTLETTSFVECKKFRSTTMIAGKQTNMFFDGDTMYTWVDGQASGMQMAMSCINDLKAASPQGQASAPTVQAPEDQFKNATDVKCVAASDADFTVPTTVTFSDQCALLKKSTEMMKNLPKGTVPTDLPTNMPNIPNY